jgi:hypothetical protein
MAKADLNSVEKGHRAAQGRVLKRAIELAGMNDKEAGAVLGAVVPGGKPIDKAQLSRWFGGDENAQTWRFLAVPLLRDAYRLAEAEDAGESIGNVTVRTVIEMTRRTA